MSKSTGDWPYYPPNPWPYWNPAPVYSYPPVGCICPPTSEQTCQNPTCPRKPFQRTAYGTGVAPCGDLK